MNTKLGFISSFFICLITASPNSNDDKTLIIDKNYYYDGFIRYKGQHDIVNILVAIKVNTSNNAIENSHEKSDSPKSYAVTPIFFVEADLSEDGKRIDQGLYVLNGDEATKLLDHGRDATTDYKSIFFGAKDGIYIYKDGKAEKYGTITDSIIQIAKEKSNDIFYVLTEDHELYKVYDNCNKKEKLNVDKPQEFVLDFKNNIFFNSLDNVVKVVSKEGTKKIEGLPANFSSLKLIKPPFTLEVGVPLIVDNFVYVIFPNGSAEDLNIKLESGYKPTAYAPEATYVQHYGYNKKIYEINVLLLRFTILWDKIENYLFKNSALFNKLSREKYKSFVNNIGRL